MEIVRTLEGKCHLLVGKAAIGRNMVCLFVSIVQSFFLGKKLIVEKLLGVT